MWSPPDLGIGGRGDQLMLQAGRRGGGLESGWVLVGFGAPKIMGARPHKMGARPHSDCLCLFLILYLVLVPGVEVGLSSDDFLPDIL
jgi:hypothetical protein